MRTFKHIIFQIFTLNKKTNIKKALFLLVLCGQAWLTNAQSHFQTRPVTDSNFAMGFPTGTVAEASDDVVLGSILACISLFQN